MIENQNKQISQEEPFLSEEYPAEPQVEVEAEIQTQAEQVAMSIRDQLESRHAMVNIAEGMGQAEIDQLAARVIEDYNTDLESRVDWEKANNEWMDLARLAIQKKTWAGETVANVKYPIITNATIQFASRAYPEIIKGEEVVKPKVIGQDQDGQKLARGERVSKHMSYQLLNEMPGWEADVDQLLFTLPVVGCAFKKTYFSAIESRNVSEMVFASNLVVHYYAESLQKASRITHVVELTQNEIVERIRSGVYLDFDIEELGTTSNEKWTNVDEDTPHKFLEQHRWYDLDGDGYQEPYIVTVHEESQKLVRISARYELSGVQQNEKGEIIRIEPVHYFTRFLFMPSPDGSFYGMGFGSLLYSINSAANTALNQLLDAGTLANRQSGFLGRGLQLGRGASLKLRAGEWKPVQATGDDLRKNIVPMNVKEPSRVLFQLLGMLIDSGKELSGITDVLSGQSPGSNVPAETTLALIEQGLQVYSAIHKRIHRSLYHEFQKIRRLNRLYLSNESYNTILDEPSDVQADYNSTDHDIIPVSDPNSTTNMQRIIKARALLDMRGQGFDDNEINKRYLKALQIDDIEGLIPKEAPPPDPIEELALADKQADIQVKMSESNKIAVESELVAEKIQTEKVAQQVKMMGTDFDRKKLQLEEAQTINNIKNTEANNQRETAKLINDIKTKDTRHKEVDDSQFEGKTGQTNNQGPYREKGLVSNNEDV